MSFEQHAPGSDESEFMPIEQVGPITTSPDLKTGNGFKRLVKNTWKEKNLDPLRSYLFVPAQPPGAFASQPLAQLADRLKTADQDVAKAILAEAEAIFQEPVDRIDSAERRATTLQGTVAIAASVAAAGGGLLLDPASVQGEGWRVAFGMLLFLFVLCLAGCAMRALGATSRIFRFEEPGAERIVDRRGKDKCEVLTYRAAELLRASAVSDQIGRAKVGLLRSAAWWFRLAILVLAALTGLIAAYAVAGPQEPPAQTRSTSMSAPTTPSHQTRELAFAYGGGCCTKPSQKSRSALAEVHARAAVRDSLGTDGPLATDRMAVFEAHP